MHSMRLCILCDFFYNLSETTTLVVLFWHTHVTQGRMKRMVWSFGLQIHHRCKRLHVIFLSQNIFIFQQIVADRTFIIISQVGRYVDLPASLLSGLNVGLVVNFNIPPPISIKAFVCGLGLCHVWDIYELSWVVDQCCYKFFIDK